MPSGTLPGARLHGIHVLIVDDREESRHMLRYALEGSGAVVTVAASAEQALARFQEVQPAVIVTDLDMPDADGYDLLRSLRAIEARSGRETPTILVTGLSPHEHREHARRAGFAAFLSKPFDLEQLYAVILEVTRHR